MRRGARRRPGRKLLGVDLGERWIGIAVTDDTGVLAAPVETIDLRRATLEAVANIATQRQVAGIVAGLPRTLSGTEGFQAARAREQVAQLRELVALPVIFWDERLTSAMAEQIARDRGGRRRRKGVQHDALAAAIMLQSYIDAHPLKDRKDQDAGS